MKKTLIIGVGSILRADDGLGIRVIEELERGHLPENVSLRAADVSGLDLLKYFPGFDKVIIVDAADMNKAPGEIKIFRAEEIKKNFFAEEVSTHGMSLTETLTLAEKVGMPAEIFVVGVQSQDTSFKLELSRKIKESIPAIVKKIEDITNA